MYYITQRRLNEKNVRIRTKKSVKIFSGGMRIKHQLSVTKRVSLSLCSRETVSIRYCGTCSAIPITRWKNLKNKYLVRMVLLSEQLFPEQLQLQYHLRQFSFFFDYGRAVALQVLQQSDTRRSSRGVFAVFCKSADVRLAASTEKKNQS